MNPKMDDKGIMTRQRNSLSLLGLGIGSLAAIIGVTATIAVAIPNGTPASAKQLIAQAGSPLAKELQGKPVVVDIYASWCPGCKNIAPTLSNLKQQYRGTAHFVVLDVTNRSTTKASEEKAKKLGLGSFFAANKSQTSTVAIIDPATGRILRQFRNNPNQADYKVVLNTAIAQMKGK